MLNVKSEKCGRGILPFNFSLLTFSILLLASHTLATSFPDTAELKKFWKVQARKDGRPVLLSRIQDGDSLSLALEWQNGKTVSARLEQGEEFDDDAFAQHAGEYGAGAAWHEFDDGKRPYEGLVQQWALKGYGQETGWLGAGVHRGRYFLIFRAAPPVPLAKSDSPLALGPSVAAYLDSSSRWLKTPCQDADWARGEDGTGTAQPPRSAGRQAAKPGKASVGKPVCYRSADDSRLRVRILSRSPLSLEARLEEGGSPALKEIRRVVQTVPDAAQAEYARDLSQMLLSEGQIYLAKLGQILPGLFNWPTWQLQGSKEGMVPPERYLSLVRSDEEPGDFLPALQLDGKRIRLGINLYYKGTLHLEAQERP